MEFIDTQIVSYVFKGNTDLYDDDIAGKNISSIVALEFLGIMNVNNTARLYPFANLIWHPELSRLFKKENKAAVKYGKMLTDRIVLDFNGEFDSIIIYSNEAISRLINEERREDLLFIAECSLDKTEYRKFKDRLEFLLEKKIKVFPVNAEIVSKMHGIYTEIQTRYNVKDNYRNSFMDLLIVATAIVNKEPLISKDKELNKVLKEFSKEIKVDALENGTMKIYTAEEDTDKPEKKNEINGYVNSGWKVFIRKGNLN